MIAMAKYRNNLPQLGNQLFLTDGGIETTLIFHEGIELPYFAAFKLLATEEGRKTLHGYYARYAAIARHRGLGFIFESATWRASPDWAAKLGLSQAELDGLNRAAIDMLKPLRVEFETARSPMVISGCLGPRGDGYKADARMTAEQAAAYHSAAISIYARADADMVTAITMTYAEEAAGVAQAAAVAGMPVAISFTVETDGCLPSGQPLGEAIESVDAATPIKPAYYMINCAHPTHFADALAAKADWVTRIKGVRANASKRSHAELDAAPDLDAGDPVELGAEYAALRRRLGSRLNVLGGCCGTDHRHIEAIAMSCVPELAKAS
jgi:S-methylmethionine-dependent homocysteine/selenocysteine methylase